MGWEPLKVGSNCCMGITNVYVLSVYHLSAQFPGPTTPRDFVTLLLTSSSALGENVPLRPSSSASVGGEPSRAQFTEMPRHFMVISRPCEHPDCPPRDGFIRGQYESIEFIREIPLKKMKSSSTTDLLKNARLREPTSLLEEEVLLRNAEIKAKQSAEASPNGQMSPGVVEDIVKEEGRKRGKTISFAGSRGSRAKGENMDNPHAQDEDEMNPVEWIMVTRSDPGGSVPRFMVERGTPGGIVADASKFLDWACKKEHPEDEVEALDKSDLKHIEDKKRQELEAFETNGPLARLDGEGAEPELPAVAVPLDLSIEPPQVVAQGGLLSTVAGAAYAGIENYAPQAFIDRLPGHSPSQSMSASAATIKQDGVPNGVHSNPRTPSISSASSVRSFASAEDHFDDETLSINSTHSHTRSSNSKDTISPHRKELAKLNERKRKLDESLAKAREKEMKGKKELTAKEEERVRKAEEKHAREIAKQEEKYKKEVARLAAKRQKDAAKTEERKKKAEDKDEKTRLMREKEASRQELDLVSKERDILRLQVGELQRENASLVVRLGKTEDGKEVLREVKKEAEGNRSRSGSLRKSKNAVVEQVKGATILGGDKGVGVEAMK